MAYSEEYKAECLALLDANGGNVKRTAKELDLPYSTLYDWSKNRYLPDNVPEIQNKKRADLLAIIEEHIYGALEAADGKRPEASYKDLITGAAILIDKGRLLADQPTNIVGVKNLSDAERANRVNELLDRARDRRTGLLADGDSARQ
jgi:hypothetical protein